MQREPRKWIAGIMVVAALASACGSDGGGGPSGVSSGITPSKPVGTLTPAEVTQLCKTVDQAFKDPAVTDGLCKFAAVFAATAATLFLPNATDAQLQMACTMSYTECKKPDSTMEECKAPPASCTATVGELEKCLADTKVALAGLGNGVPACSSLTKASLSSSPPNPGALSMEAESCKALEQKCPGLVPDPELPN